MYNVLTSFWSKSPTSTNNKTRLSSINSSDLSIDEDGWVLVSDRVSKIAPPSNDNNIMTNSWVASPPLMRTDESSVINRASSPTATHHFNPIENLLIEHASMSVYEQIASKTRTRRPRKFVYDDEQVEEGDEDEEDDDDHNGRVSANHHHPNLTSIHHRNMNISSNSFTTTLESSTLSLAAHHRHLQRLHQRRKRTNKSTSKLAVPTTVDEQPKQEFKN